MSGVPFNRPTTVAFEPGTDAFYVADGYSNAHVHKFSGDGALLHSWGASGTEPGHFNIVHDISVDSAGRVYIADRENHRVQIFCGGRHVPNTVGESFESRLRARGPARRRPGLRRRVFWRH